MGFSLEQFFARLNEILSQDCDPVAIQIEARDFVRDQEAYADKKIFAAAPDLLEALILLEAEMVASGNAESRDFGWKPAIEKTRAAITKATA